MLIDIDSTLDICLKYLKEIEAIQYSDATYRLKFEFVREALNNSKANVNEVKNILMTLSYDKRNKYINIVNDIDIRLDLFTKTHEIFIKKMNKEKYMMEQREQLMNKRFGPEQIFIESIDTANFNRFNSSHARSNNDLDGLINTGHTVLDSLRHSSDVMRKWRSSLQSICYSLDSSGTLMRIIDRRGTTDKFIFYTMCIGFIGLMILVWKYLK